MSQKAQERKKYAVGWTPRKQTQPQIVPQTVSLTDLWEQVRALDVRVQNVSLPRTPKRMRRRPRIQPVSAVTEAVTSKAAADDLNNRQAVLSDLIDQARALVPDPPDSPTRRACRESPLDEGIVEKFRRQGFRL